MTIFSLLLRNQWLIALFSIGSITDHELMMSSDSQYFFQQLSSHN